MSWKMWWHYMLYIYNKFRNWLRFVFKFESLWPNLEFLDSLQKRICFISDDVFQGDSGGPATYKHVDQHILAGVFSAFGTPCGSESVMERVAYYRIHFIEKILNGATVCKSGVDVDVDDWHFIWRILLDIRNHRRK